jgi:hypothetical protein
VNPLLALPEGALGLDARVILWSQNSSQEWVNASRD